MSGRKTWRILDEFLRTINLITKEEYAVKEDNLVGYRNMIRILSYALNAGAPQKSVIDNAN